MVVGAEVMAEMLELGVEQAVALVVACVVLRVYHHVRIRLGALAKQFPVRRAPARTARATAAIFLFSSARERVCASIYTPMWLIVVPLVAQRSWLKPRLCFRNPRLH